MQRRIFEYTMKHKIAVLSKVNYVISRSPNAAAATVKYLCNKHVVTIRC